MLHNGTFSISDWDQFSSTHAYGHFLQTGAWGELKSNHDWRAAWSCVFNPNGEMNGGGGERQYGQRERGRGDRPARDHERSPSRLMMLWYFSMYQRFSLL